MISVGQAKRMLAGFCAAALLMVGWAQQAAARPSAVELGDGQTEFLAREFDARRLTKREKRLLQIGLTQTGDYLGMLDGKWGKGAQRALESYSLREFGDFIVPTLNMAPIVARVLKNEDALGFSDQRFEDSNAALTLPVDILEPTSQAGFAHAWRDPHSTLLIALSSIERRAPRAQHQAMRREASRTPDAYLVTRRDRLVTSYRESDGSMIYLRSDRSRRGWTTLLVRGDGTVRQHAHRVVAASFYVGPPRRWLSGPTPWVSTLVSAILETPRGSL